ncbi:MAG: Hpt domain-containing protein [Acetobacteraceae bacterium]|jgi:HPt (histidine-containing phosphotransfer) domain-containing protein
MTVGAFASSGPGARGIPAIDRSVLGEWLAGDDTAIDELLAVFRDSVFAEQERMQDALGLGDLNAYADAAHRLRGAALSMGARALAEVSGTLTAAAQARDETACRNGLSVLGTHVCLVAAEIPVPRTGGQSQERA